MSSHPYYPPDIALPNYVPNDKHPLLLIAVLALWAVSIISSAWWIIGFLQPTLSVRDRRISVWFVMCGILHIGFEGYYVCNARTITSQQTIWAQLWKEYSLSDSRYLLVDYKVICLEAITVLFWGPLSLLTAYWTVKHDTRRLLLQTVVCIAHIYGCTLYYATSLVELVVDGRLYSRPEPLYFWGYFVGMNAPFIIIPGYLLYLAFEETVTESRRVSITKYT
ncbi:EBP domain protein [Microthyrium microscopicum]|uniref:EBP domain protein n=1 Tax=Microthyrium microscopicum TaxID=703497 RepID=A0A6A6U1A2_9PEZI|nr:EBP domain protein [Microthyrium microscopicum]